MNAAVSHDAPAYKWVCNACVERRDQYLAVIKLWSTKLQQKWQEHVTRCAVSYTLVLYPLSRRNLHSM